MTRRLTLLALLLLTPTAARADIVNGGFEAGDLSGFSLVGASESGAFGAYTVQAPGRTPAAGVSTAPFAGGYQAVIRPTVGANQQALEATLGLPALALSPGPFELIGNGGAIYQDVTAAAGDRLLFRASFTELDDNEYLDYAFYSVTGPGTAAAVRLPFNPVSTSDITGSAYRAYEYEFTAAGTYRVGFGVVNARDSNNDPYLFLDDVRVESARGPSPVPAPAGVVLGLLGVATVLGFRRWKTPARSNCS